MKPDTLEHKTLTAGIYYRFRNRYIVQIRANPKADMKLYPASNFNDQSCEAVELLSALLPDAVVEAVGATSISGAVTKGDIDIFIGVDKSSFSSTINTLRKHGFRPKVDTLQTDELRMLESTRTDIDLACQVVVLGSQYDVFRKFRDRLNQDRALVELYNQIKQANSHLCAKDYRDAKATFIEKILSK